MLNTERLGDLDTARRDLENKKLILDTAIDIQALLRLLVDKKIITKEEVNGFRKEVRASSKWRFSRGRRMSEIDDMVCKLAEAEVTSELEYMLWEIYKECDSEDELEEKYDEIRSLSACCLERRAEEIGLNPDTVSY